MNESKKLIFELSSQDLKIRTLLNREFLAVDIDAISNVYPNRNKSHFTEEAMKKAIPTFYEKPILGAFDVLRDDYLGHNTSILSDEFGVHEDTTGGRNEVPLGLVRHSDKVELVEKNGQKWISLSAALWVNYSYRQVKKLLKSKGKKVSVEVEVTKYHMDENDIEVIDEFSLMGITILGSDYTEAIPNANISIPELMETESYQLQKKSLTFAYQELDKSLGVTPESSDNTIENFSDTPINNEDTEEIAMDNNNERGGETVPMFTMEEKKQILRDALKDGEHYVYVFDLNDDEVYYEDSEGTFAAPYTISTTEDGKAIASVDVSAKVPILCSWKKYSENENPEAEKENFEEKEVEAEDKKENESEDERKKDEAAEGECKLSEDECKLSEEEKREDSASEEECKLSDGEPCECESAEKCDDDKPCEYAAEEPADNKEEEVKEEEPSEKQEESAENKEDEAASEPEAECEMAEEENPENECKMSEDDEDDKNDTDEDDKNDKEENSAEGEPCECALTFTVGEKTYSADEFKAEFEAMSAKIAEYEAKIAEYESQFAQAKNSEIYTYVCSVIDSEEDLTAENKEVIKNAMKENCDKGTYSANDEAQEATEHFIADALYQQKKMSKNAKSEKDFSVSIVKETSTVVTNNSGLEDLKDAIANLQKI